MTRQQLLNQQTGEVSNLISNTIEKDHKFIRRTIQDLDNQIEDAEAVLEERMKSMEPIDASTIKILYKKVIELYSEKELFILFGEEFYTEDNSLNGSNLN